jgi:hypothetical protein
VTPEPQDLPGMPEVVDQVALARLYGEPLFAMPADLYIPPDALEVFLEAFEGARRPRARSPRTRAPSWCAACSNTSR